MDTSVPIGAEVVRMPGKVVVVVVGVGVGFVGFLVEAGMWRVVMLKGRVVGRNVTKPVPS